MAIVKQVSILGSTSTIGVNTLDVISTNRDKYSVFALTANTNIDLLEQQCRRYVPAYAALRDETLVEELDERLSDIPTEVIGGDKSLCDVASHPDTDMIMAAIVGSAGLQPTLAAVRA